MSKLHTSDTNRNNNDGVTSTKEVTPNVKNTYQQKKNIAQGMIDFALISTNVNQLRYVLDSSSHPYYYFSVITISLSIILQVLVFIGLILSTRCKKTCRATMLNDLVLIGAALIIVTNLFIASFSRHGVQ